MVLEGQSVIDIAIQLTGKASTAFALSVKNSISLTAPPVVGSNLQPVPVANSGVVQYYQLRDIRPATYTATALEAGSGIDWMAVAETFGVQ